MVYHGRIRNGIIVLDELVRLPEGAEVRVNIVTGEKSGNGDGAKSTIWNRLLEIAGTADDLPSDAARRVDHYLYGDGDDD